MREIKFRAWCGDYFEYSEFNHKTGCMGCNFSVNTDDGKPIQQYTGIKDKNGIDICEFDIYRHNSTGQVGVIRFDNARFYLDISNLKHLSLVGVEDGCVIGNIYENPELLKE